MSWPAPWRVRAVLAPAGHAAVHELRVAGEADVGADAEALHDARAEALDERVGLLDEVEQRRHAVGVLEVDADGAPAAVARRRRAARRVAGRARPARGRRGSPRRPCRRAAWRANGPGADAGDLDDPVAGRAVLPCGCVAARVRPLATDAAPTCVMWLAIGVDDQRPQRLRQVVAHVGEHSRSAPGISSAVRSPPLGRDQRVVAAVDDERRDVARRAAARCDRRWRRSRPAGAARPRGRSAVERGRRGLDRVRSDRRTASSCEDLRASADAVDVRLALGRRRR